MRLLIAERLRLSAALMAIIERPAPSICVSLRSSSAVQGLFKFAIVVGLFQRVFIDRCGACSLSQDVEARVDGPWAPPQFDRYGS
jgi:hypothetical protein